MQHYGIDHEAIVELDREFRLDALVVLNQPRPVSKRRVSLADGGLYNVRGYIQETGSDFLAKIPRGNNVKHGATAATAPSDQAQSTNFSVNFGASTSSSISSDQSVPSFATLARSASNETISLNIHDNDHRDNKNQSSEDDSKNGDDDSIIDSAIADGSDFDLDELISQLSMARENESDN